MPHVFGHEAELTIPGGGIPTGGSGIPAPVHVELPSEFGSLSPVTDPTFGGTGAGEFGIAAPPIGTFSPAVESPAGTVTTGQSGVAYTSGSGFAPPSAAQAAALAAIQADGYPGDWQSLNTAFNTWGSETVQYDAYAAALRAAGSRARIAGGRDYINRKRRR